MTSVCRHAEMWFSAMFVGSVILLTSVTSGEARAQDAGTLAAQQSAQAAAQASQQATEAAHRAMEDAQRANEQAMRDSTTNTGPTIAYTQAPTFSVRPGNVLAGTTVRIKSPTHYAVIYYTTNGWTPTTSSKRYTEPITIMHTMQLQAIAVAPRMTTSQMTSAKYLVAGTSAKLEPAALSTDGLLKAGTELHLVTASTATSKSAEVGDHLKLELAHDIVVQGTAFVPKGTPVDAVITQADRPGHLGLPGDLAFEVKSLTVEGIEIPLKGGETLEGTNHFGRAKGIFLIPVVGISGIAVRGEEAEIKPGMELTASVEKDVLLRR